MGLMKILLRDINPALVEAWHDEFHHVADVSVSRGSIFDVSADAIVSPANSFGFMDGGIDLAYSEHFGWAVEDRLRARLREDFDGELPVGCAVVVETGDAAIPWLVSAPTMRVPMDVSRTANAFLAFRAALRAVRAHNAPSNLRGGRPIQSILCPGLGSAIGKMAPATCARQMREALDAFRAGPGSGHASLAFAVEHHMSMTD